MSGRKERDQVELFVAGSLRDLPPEDHAPVSVEERLAAIEATPAEAPGRTAADAAHGAGRIRTALEDRRIESRSADDCSAGTQAMGPGGRRDYRTEITFKPPASSV